jgi:YD repeat-containing protein
MLTRLALAILVVFVMIISVAPMAIANSVGNMPGSFQVGHNGDAQYSIPIWTPPGIHGVQPNLALVYDSHSGLGTMGPGWSISGLSSIYRCNSTYAQDGTPSAITLTLSDRFCLDRKRLRLTSTETLSDYGAASTTYQTEVADFSLVTASSTETENGPSSFTVQGKDGLTYEYGATTSSQIFVPGNGTPYIWALDKVTDRAGNYMTYTYTQTNGSYVISSIQYTAPSGSTTFLYQVEFKYTTLPAGAAGIRTRYLAGGQVQQTQELNSITVQLYGTTTDLRLYSLGYSASPTTARDTLTTITECGGSAGTDCLPATTIGYQSGTAGVASPATSTGSGTTNGAVYSVDMDGDGRQDFLFAVTSGSNIEWWVQLATSTGYKAPINTGAVTTGTTNVLVDTFEGTPQNEILVPVSGIWYEYKCPDLNCTAFTATSTKIAVTTAAQYSSADVDGDGRPDLVSLVPGNPDVACVDSLAYPNNLVSVQLNTMTSSLSFADTPVVTYASCASEYESPRLIGNNQMQTSSVKKMDFDGDGRQDLMLTYTTINDGTKPVTVTSGAIQLLSRGTGAVGAGYSLPGGPLFAVNWNDDACTDMIALETGSTTAYEVYTSTCNGASGPFIPLTGVTPVLALDWDGDGRTDILGNVGGNFEVYRSEGSAVAAGVSTGISVGSGNYTVTDQNGDGLDDLVLANSANNYSLTYGLHAGANTLPDLATSFTDAYGNVVKPWYTSIVPGDGTTFFPQNAVSFPYQNFLAPYYVTGAATFSDPTSSSNGTYTIYYYFAGASLNLQGRGFSMGTIQTYDPRSGIWDTRIANFVFPYTGMPSYEIADLANSTSDTLHSNNWTLKEVTLDATANNERYFPYIFNVLKETNEPSEANYPEITSASTTYTYDNYGNATNVSTVTTDEDTGSPYYGDTWTSTTATTITADTSTWCLDVPTETQVTNSSTAPGGAAITRTVTYTPDYSNCRVSGKVTAPGTSYQVSEVYGFDAFGNVNSDAVTGTGMATRTTGITWGTTGQFPTIIKNAFGQSITLTYDPNTGNPLSQTDPNYTTANPLQTTWKYDDFGRKSQETRPDGTYTTWTYENCASWGGCLLGTYGLDIFQQVFGSNGTVIQSGTTEYDALNRPILWNKLLINDTYDLNEVKYDNLGRIASQAEPCAWGGSATTLCPYWITYQYDVLNRMTESQRPISATNSTLQTTQYGYAGRTSTVKDALSNTTTKITLVTGKMARSTDPKGYYQNFTYDAFGSLTAVTDSASNALFSATYAYGIGAFQTATTDMDMGAWTYTVDPLGEVTGHKDAKNQSFSQSYDLLSRPLVRTEPDLTTTWTWGTSAASYNIGQLASISSTQGSVTYSEAYTYDNKTRLSGKSITIPGDSTYAYSYAYNPTTGLPSSLTYPAEHDQHS